MKKYCCIEKNINAVTTTIIAIIIMFVNLQILSSTSFMLLNVPRATLNLSEKFARRKQSRKNPSRHRIRAPDGVRNSVYTVNLSCTNSNSFRRR